MFNHKNHSLLILLAMLILITIPMSFASDIDNNFTADVVGIDDNSFDIQSDINSVSDEDSDNLIYENSKNDDILGDSDPSYVTTPKVDGSSVVDEYVAGDDLIVTVGVSHSSWLDIGYQEGIWDHMNVYVDGVKVATYPEGDGLVEFTYNLALIKDNLTEGIHDITFHPNDGAIEITGPFIFNNLTVNVKVPNDVDYETLVNPTSLNYVKGNSVNITVNTKHEKFKNSDTNELFWYVFINDDAVKTDIKGNVDEFIFDLSEVSDKLDNGNNTITFHLNEDSLKSLEGYSSFRYNNLSVYVINEFKTTAAPSFLTYLESSPDQLVNVSASYASLGGLAQGDGNWSVYINGNATGIDIGVDATVKNFNFNLNTVIKDLKMGENTIVFHPGEDILANGEFNKFSYVPLTINYVPNLNDEEEAIYVSTNGNDDENTGNKTSPFKTIYRALEEAYDTGIQNIYIENGTYYECGLEILTSVNIIGRGNVIIDAENYNRIFKVKGQYNVGFYNLTLINGKAPADEWEWDDHGMYQIYYAAGGAIDIQQAHVTMDNMKFIDNSASDFGGAINVNGNMFTITNSLFENNYADVHAGAIDIEGDKAVVDNCRFISNNAANGGAIGCIANAATIKNSYFEGNIANGEEHGGGAISIQNGPYNSGTNTHYIKFNKFIKNEAVQQGGAINVENQLMEPYVDGTLIEENDFINNSAFNGGAISAYYGDAYIKNNNFFNNTGGFGGAIASITSLDSYQRLVGGLYLENNSIVDCSASENGNAIFNMGYIGTPLNITFIEGNTIYSDDGKAVVLNVTVFDDVGNPISGTPVEFTVGGKATFNIPTDLVEGVSSVRFVPRENGTFNVSGSYFKQYNTGNIYNVINGKIIVENAIPDYFGIIHVSSELGDDDNTGSEDSPVKTFNQGYLLATRDGGSFNIVVHKGTYYVPGYTVEKSFNITGIDNPILDGNKEATLFSLYGGRDDEFHITGLTFKNGVASPSRDASINEGGAIFLKGGKLYLENDVFASNFAKDYGGAVYVNKGMDFWGDFYDSFGYITNCNFTNNEANYFGGAIGLYESHVIVTGCNFISNKAKSGGAISVASGMGNLTVVDCTFKQNSASEFGGALDIDEIYTRHHSNVYNSIFISNTANYGGAINVAGSNISNCVFIKNSANYGGAVFSNTTFLGEPVTDKTVVEYSIFDSNTAKIDGLDYYGTSFLINNNFWGNNYNYLNDLKNNNVIFFVSDNNELSWINLEIEGQNEILPGNREYTLKFISNDGSALKNILPDYNVQLSNDMINNELNTYNALVSNNYVVLTYGAIDLGKDEISVINNGNKIITSKSIEVVENSSGGNNGTGDNNATGGNNSTAGNATGDNATGDSNSTAGNETGGNATGGNNSTAGNATGNNSSSEVIKIGTKLILSDQTFVVTSKSNKVTILLVDDKYDPISNKNIICNINGVPSVVKTNAKGQATLKINLKVKTYKLTVSFAGDGNYKSSKAAASIKIVKEKTKLKVPKKTYKKSSKSKKVYITLKSASGKALAKKKVTFKIKGKKYKVKTNKKGKVTVKVKLTAKKTYKFTVKFAGDSMYSAVSKKSSIKIK